MSKTSTTNLNQGQIKFTTGQILDENTILHRLLFSLTEHNCKTVNKMTLGYWKWAYKKGKFPPATREKILIASGFIIEKKAEWKYIGE